MAKEQTRTKSRTSKRAKKPGFNFKWWMGVVLVVVVAGIGLAIIQFSQASSVRNIYASPVQGFGGSCNIAPSITTSYLYLGSGSWCENGVYRSGIMRWRRTDGTCAFMRVYNSNSSTKGEILRYKPRGGWVTVYETTSCNV